MDHTEFLRRPAHIRALGGAKIYPFLQSNASVVNPALKSTTEGAVNELVNTAKGMENAGSVGTVVNKLQAITQTSPMTVGTEPAPGAVNANSAVQTQEQTPVGAVSLTTGPIRRFVNNLPPVVNGPLRWAPAIGLGLYLGGMHKAGLIVGGLGIARYAVKKGWLGNV